MIDIYTKCSRCGELFEGDSDRETAYFEAVKFFRVGHAGTVYCAIKRDDEGEQEEFRQEYPLCPDCLADTLDFVRGKA